MFRKSQIKGKKVLESESDEDPTCVKFLPKRRNRGVCVVNVIGNCEEKEEINEGLGKKFVKSKTRIDQIHTRNLENYIRETLNEPDQGSSET